MELDDMKLAWASLDGRVARQQDLAQATHLVLGRDALRRGLWPTRAGVVVRGLAGLALMAVAAAYWVPRWGSAHLVAWGWMLQAYGALLVVTSAIEARHLRHIDCAGPVLEQQRRVAALRAWRIGLVPVWTATGCLVWIPALLAAFDAGLGADVWAHAPAVVAAFFASGLGVIAAFTAIRRHWPAAARYLDRSSVGGGLARARAVLDEIERFERE